MIHVHSDINGLVHELTEREPGGLGIGTPRSHQLITLDYVAYKKGTAKLTGGWVGRFANCRHTPLGHEPRGAASAASARREVQNSPDAGHYGGQRGGEKCSEDPTRLASLGLGGFTSL